MITDRYSGLYTKSNFLKLNNQFLSEKIQLLSDINDKLEKENYSLNEDIKLYLSIINNLEENEEKLRDQLSFEKNKNLVYINGFEGFFQT